MVMQEIAHLLQLLITIISHTLNCTLNTRLMLFVSMPLLHCAHKTMDFYFSVPLKFSEIKFSLVLRRGQFRTYTLK